MREKQKEAARKHYANNKKKVMAKVQAYKVKKKKEWWDYKKSLSCVKCGASHPAIIDFHHIDKHDPTKQKVHKLVQCGRYAAAYEEIEKCLILCANCHRIHHWDERETDGT